jgi:hypothetical protein
MMSTQGKEKGDAVMAWLFLALMLGWLSLTLINGWRVYVIERRWERAVREHSNWAASQELQRQPT